MVKKRTGDALGHFEGILFGYQKRWLADEARYKIMLKPRQAGVTLFCGTLEATILALKGQPNYYLSAGERQSKAAIEDVKSHARALKTAIESVEENVVIDDREWKVLEVRFPGGGKVVGFPANPSTIRGARGNMFFDEYAFHKDSTAIWRAGFPIISHGWKVRVFSTPNGQQGDFYDKWERGGPRWSRHKVTIYDAVKDGLPLDIEELREGIGNEDDWLQEYCCEFLDTALNWVPLELLDAADDKNAWLEPPVGWQPEGQLFLGVDVGRKRDLTVLWLHEVLGDVRWTRGCIVLEKTPFRQQRERIEELMPMVRRCAIDATGMGMQLAEELVERWGSRVEPVTFTGANKEMLATGFRKSLEDRRWRIPVDLEIRRDFRRVKRVVTAAGNVRFDADRSDSGHADRFWAAALAEYAFTGCRAQPFTYEPIHRLRGAELREGGERRNRGPVFPGEMQGRGGFHAGGVW